MPNTLTIIDGGASDKVYHLSGQFSSTVKTSQSVATWTTSPTGVSWDGTNTLFSGTTPNDKLYLLSGLFTSTLKTSQDINSIDNNPQDISCDNNNTPWCGWGANKLYLQSGRFTSTLKTSQSVARPTGISWDNINTPRCSDLTTKLYLQSGQFSSTIKTSLAIIHNPGACTYSAGNTPWCELSAFANKKLYLQSGQFSSTIKTSRVIAPASMVGIETEPYGNRLGYNQSMESIFALSQDVDGELVYSIEHGLVISQFIILSGGSYLREVTSYLSALPLVRYDGNGQYTIVERGLRQDIVQDFHPNRIQYNDIKIGQQIGYNLIRAAGVPKSVQSDIVLDQSFELSRSLYNDLSITQAITGTAAKAPRDHISLKQIISLQKVLNISVTTPLGIYSTHTHYVL